MLPLQPEDGLRSLPPNKAGQVRVRADPAGHHVESVLKDVPVADRCDCPHVPIVDLPGLRLMKTVKKDPNYAGGAGKKPEL